MLNSHCVGLGPAWAPQPRNVSSPSPPHISPVMCAALWGGNNVPLTTKHGFKSFVCFASQLIIYHLKNVTGEGTAVVITFIFTPTFLGNKHPVFGPDSHSDGSYYLLAERSRSQPAAAHALLTRALQSIPLFIYFLWRVWFLERVRSTESSGQFLTLFSPQQTQSENINRGY